MQDNENVYTFDGYAPIDWLYQYLESISTYEQLSLEETIALAIRVQEGDQEALSQLITSNLKLAYTIAKNFYDTKCRRLELDDLIQEANLGLRYAALHFNPTQGQAFSSYAAPCIVGFMKRAIAYKTSCIHIPNDMYQSYLKMLQIKNQVYLETGIEPSLYDLATRMEVPVNQLISISRIYSVSSLDSPVVAEDDSSDTLLDRLSDTDESEFYAPFAYQTTDRIRKLFDECDLNENERAIVVAYFGLGDAPPKSLRKLSQDFPFTFQRAQRILKKALRKLRYTTFQDYRLEDFLA